MGKPKKKKGKMSQAVVRENIQLYLLMLPVFLLIIVFCYGPMFGLVISFQDYMPGSPFWGEGVEWVGLTHFKRFVEGKYFGRLIKNTLVLSGMNLLFGFTAPILFALLIDQIKRLRFKKIAQTASYMPYFISTVVVAGMVISFIDQGGLISNFLSAVFGLPNQNWRDQAPAFPAIYTITNRGQQCWYITLPGIKNIIAINLILAIGGILGTNSDLILLLYSPATYDVADVIGTYTYRLGIEGGQYSYTAAAGLFMSVIGFALTYIANKVSDKLTGFGLW